MVVNSVTKFIKNSSTINDKSMHFHYNFIYANVITAITAD